MDHARIKVMTDCMFQINNPVLLEVEGIVTKVSMFEERPYQLKSPDKSSGPPSEHLDDSDQKY